MTQFKSGAGYEGFPSSETEGLAYLYGLSDFWSVIFEDTDLVDRFLESSSIGLAGIYSRFLQLTSSISVNDVQTFLYDEVRLLTLYPSDKVDSVSGTTYLLPEGIVGCKYILDRPMLAVNTLEENVHYTINPEQSTITFYKPLEEINMPSRITSDGRVQVSMWMTDVSNDESLVFKYFGELINVTPQTVTRVYRDFIRGLYFLYTQGPTVTLLERGLSLALGIPLARTDEKVLLTVRNETTGNWIVATDRSSYSIPYGLEPEVQPGDQLESGKEMVKVAEVKDYLVEDEWWLNLSIPEELIPFLPDEGQRVASPGNITDSIMREYLKYHTFLVRIKWDKTFTASNFDEVFRILYDAKPSYTYPIFVWSIVDTEIIDLTDEDLRFEMTYELVDSFGCGGPYIQRNYLKLNERSETCFIHGNYDPSNDDPSIHQTTRYTVPLSRIYNDSSVIEADAGTGDIVDSVAVYSYEMTPLYNTTNLDVRQSVSALGVTLPEPTPSVFMVGNIPVTQTNYDRLVIREPVSSGFTGIRKNTGQLDFPADRTHNMYKAFVPSIADLGSSMNIMFVEAQSNLYSVFVYITQPA